MKKIFIKTSMITFLAISFMVSCNSPSEKVQKAEKEVLQANEDLEEANKEYLADMENYRKETASKISANNQSILELKAKIKDQKKDAQIAYKKEIADLEQKNNDLKLKLDNYKASDKDKWEIFKEEFNHDMDELGKSVKDFTVKSTNK